MTDFRTDPIRIHSFALGPKRQRLLAEIERAAQELRQLDHELQALRRRRRDLTATMRAHRRRLWPVHARPGRQPAPDGAERLPPLPHDARPLWGRRLRAMCRSILAAIGGPVELTELHAALHDRGYSVRSAHVVKALADAMGYEVELGHARRVRRGVYEIWSSRPGRTAPTPVAAS